MKKTLKILIAFLLLVVPSGFILLKTATNLNFYAKTQIKYKVDENTGIEISNLNVIMNKLINYTKGAEIDLDFKLVIKGENQAVFNEREITHMVDVKELYKNVSNLLLGGFLFTIIFISMYIYKYKFTINIFSEFFKVTLFLLSFVLIVTFFVVIDFNRFWFFFHELIFTNDLWLLDPSTDLLINLVPEELFYSLVFQIIIKISSYLIVSNLIVYLIRKKRVEINA